MNVVNQLQQFVRQHPVARVINLILLAALPYAGLFILWMAVTALTPVHKRTRATLVLFLAAVIGAGGALFATKLDVALLGLAVLAIRAVFHRVEDETHISTPDNRPVDFQMIHNETTLDGMVKAAEAIREVTTQHLRGAAEQAEVIQMTNNQLDEFLQLAEQVSEQARLMTRTAQEATDISGRGQSALQQAISGMSQIRIQVSAIGQTIYRLAQLTRRIDEIITSVSEIATQSNLLALNASIEAARAGVHGRGFAIVAEEVRALSQQSTLAAKQVRAILGEVQNAVRETIDATEIGVQEVNTGVSVTQEADQVMEQLAGNVTVSYQAIRKISDIIREQSDGMETIAINIERIDRVMKQNIANMNVIEQVSKNLLTLAGDIHTEVPVIQ